MRLGLIASIASLLIGCQPSGLSAPALGGKSAAAPPPTERIESFVRDWFLFSKDPSHLSPDFMDFLGNDEVVLRSDDETIRGRRGVLDWITRTNHRFARVEFEIGTLEVLREDPDLLRARFHVVRRAWDEDGLLHLSSSHHSWRIEIGRENTFRLLDVEERAALYHSGTGTRILCL